MARNQPEPALVDRFGRKHTSLRISVTDRCNIRCFYCMPLGDIQFQPREHLLTFEEIVQFVRVSISLGITKYRLTGGEPLLRQDVDKLVNMLTQLDGVQEVAMTTNGLLLARHAQRLKDAGLHRLNVSLDTLDADRFEQIARRPGLTQVLGGIAEAKRVGYGQLKLNSIAVRGMTEQEVVALVEFALTESLELRFIEYMPLDAAGDWTSDDVLSASQIRQLITDSVGALMPIERDDPSQPATDFELQPYSNRNANTRIGFIGSVTEPFCGACNRLRLTADGQIRNCLFSTDEWDARAVLRSECSAAHLAELLADCVSAKKPGHGIDQPDFLRPSRAMYQIGG